MQNICNRHLRMHRIMWMASLLLLAGLLLCPSAVRAQSDDDVAYDKTIDPDKRFPVVDSHKYSCSMTVTAQVTVGSRVVGEDAIVAVYAGDEIRGKERLETNGSLAYLTIYGEGSTTLKFRLWYGGKYYEGDQTLEFKNDTSLGTDASPYAIAFPGMDIGKAVITLDGTLTYTGNAQEPTINSVVLDGTPLATTDYTVSYKNADGTADVDAADVKDAADYMLVLTGVGIYAGTATTKFSIDKAASEVTKLPAAIEDLKYTGQAQLLITAGEAAGGELQYSLDGTDYQASLPEGTEMKEYTVYYKVEGDANHNDVAAASLKVTIAPKAVTVMADDKTKVEGEADPELTAKVEGLIGEDKVTYTLSRAEGETAGEYAITVSGEAAQGNYIVSFVDAKLTITAKPKPTVSMQQDTPDKDSWTAKVGDGDYQSLPLTGLEAGTTVSFKYSGTKKVKSVKATSNGAQAPIDLTKESDDTQWTLAEMPDYDVELEVTYYTDEELDQMAADAVIAKIAAIGEVAYTEASKTLIDDARTAYDALTDAQKALISAEQLAMLTTAETTYAELKADNDAADAVIAKIAAIGEVAYTEASKTLIDDARTAYDALTDAQKALISAEQLAVLTTAETTYAELKAAAEQTAAEVTNLPAAIEDLMYTGQAQVLITAGEAAGGELQYSLDGTTYSTDIPQGTEAKEYTVYYKVEGDANHKDVAAASLKVTIAPKAVTVTADDKTKVEGEADPELTAKVEGLIGEDKVAYTLSRTEGETAGEYAITVSGEAAQGNYAVSFVSAKLTITAKPKPTGDVNDDGVVNIGDVVALSRAILSGSTDQKYDINGDGLVNAKDITALIALIGA